MSEHVPTLDRPLPGFFRIAVEAFLPDSVSHYYVDATVEPPRYYDVTVAQNGAVGVSSPMGGYLYHMITDGRTALETPAELAGRSNIVLGDFDANDAAARGGRLDESDYLLRTAASRLQMSRLCQRLSPSFWAG
jgi:hypothetical protein